MTTRPDPSHAPSVGLCATCAHVRVVETRRGSRFYLCKLSETDPRFRKYPPLPVLGCVGYREEMEVQLGDELRQGT